jgi:DNA (cytosine-5)-methyltransferase 1
MKILNLYAGIGGNRRLWGDAHEITAVEYDKNIAAIYKDLFPNDIVIVNDAHQFLLNHYKEYDFIWSSPPCPSHSKLRKTGVDRGQNKSIYPDMSLYQEILFLKHFLPKDKKWLVENVEPYYQPLIKPQVILGRHYVWCNYYVRKIGFEEKNIPIENVKVNAERYGFCISKYQVPNKRKTTLLRNLVNPEIGLYLLKQAELGKKPIFNFDY